MANIWKLEDDLNDYVKNYLRILGLLKTVDFNVESEMSDKMKLSLKGSAKTKNKTNFGKPDFNIEKYSIPVIIENKLDSNKHIAINKNGTIKTDDKSVRSFAVNGAIFYARNMIASKVYKEVIAIGITGETEETVKISVYYVFSAIVEPKKLDSYSKLDFLQSERSFNELIKSATVTKEEKHKILIKTREEILKHAKKLNKLMNNHNIGTEQRVVYVSGMLLSMQDIVSKDGSIIDYGLTPDSLQGIQTEQKRDSVIIVNHLEEYLDLKDIPKEKKKIMTDSFKMSISLDADRDKKVEIDKAVGSFFDKPVSITKQVFTYLYENIYKSIDLSGGALDIMAEMYSTFLKYALSDGAALGKVLTPPYITTLMANILEINHESRVMDCATGSAAFLVAAMALMIDDANKKYGKETKKANDAIAKIKKTQLLGVEVDAKMYTLAATNMILRGDGTSQIKKANTFETPKSLYENFKADRLLLNPPFSYEENGMPFFEFGLDNMQKGGIGAVIIQDSAGSGKAIVTNKKILSKHKMLASIKMPMDLFNPNAIVQTSIYVFQAGTPHNFDTDLVKFIDFRNDGYQRTERIIREVDHPSERYEDLFYIYKMGLNAAKVSGFHKELWKLEDVYIEDTITDSGKDWNFDQHKSINICPTENDFIDVVRSYLFYDLKKSFL